MGMVWQMFAVPHDAFTRYCEGSIYEALVSAGEACEVLDSFGQDHDVVELPSDGLNSWGVAAVLDLREPDDRWNSLLAFQASMKRRDDLVGVLYFEPARIADLVLDGVAALNRLSAQASSVDLELMREIIDEDIVGRAKQAVSRGYGLLALGL